MLLNHFVHSFRKVFLMFSPFSAWSREQLFCNYGWFELKPPTSILIMHSGGILMCVPWMCHGSWSWDLSLWFMVLCGEQSCNTDKLPLPLHNKNIQKRCFKPYPPTRMHFHGSFHCASFFIPIHQLRCCTYAASASLSLLAPKEPEDSTRLVARWE